MKTILSMALEKVRIRIDKWLLKSIEKFSWKYFTIGEMLFPQKIEILMYECLLHKQKKRRKRKKGKSEISTNQNILSIENT